MGAFASVNAVSRAREAGFNAFVHDIGQTPLHTSFDYITCFEVLEHIPHAEAAFRNLKTAFQKQMFVSIPNIGCLRCRVRLALFGKFNLTVCNVNVKEHLRHWTVHDFAYWMNKEDMHIVRIEGNTDCGALPMVSGVVRPRVSLSCNGRTAARRRRAVKSRRFRSASTAYGRLSGPGEVWPPIPH